MNMASTDIVEASATFRNFTLAHPLHEKSRFKVFREYCCETSSQIEIGSEKEAMRRPNIAKRVISFREKGRG